MGKGRASSATAERRKFTVLPEANRRSQEETEERTKTMRAERRRDKTSGERVSEVEIWRESMSRQRMRTSIEREIEREGKQDN